MKLKVIGIMLVSALFYSSGAHSENMVVNGDFEGGSGGWTVWNSPQFWVSDIFGHDYSSSCDVWTPSPYPYGGSATHCQHVGTDRAHGGLYQVIDVEPGKKYRVTGHWSGGGGGLNSEPGVAYSSWYEVVVYHGVAQDSEIDSNTIPFDVIAKKEFNLNGDQTFSFGWEEFDNTFTAQTAQVTFALKTGQYGYTYDAIAAYHDNIEMHSMLTWSLFVPAISSSRFSERR